MPKTNTVYTSKFCPNCNELITLRELVYSEGVCKHCGNVGESSHLQPTVERSYTVTSIKKHILDFNPKETLHFVN